MEARRGALRLARSHGAEARQLAPGPAREGVGSDGQGPAAEEVIQVDGVAEAEHVGGHTGRAGSRLGGGADDLDDEDGAADGGGGIRRLDLEQLAGIHAVLGDGDGDLARVEVDRGLAGHLGDREGGALADGDDGLAAQEHPDDRAIARDDAVVQEDVVLELEGHGLRRPAARRRRGTLEVRHDAGSGLREREARREEKQNESRDQASKSEHKRPQMTQFRSDRDDWTPAPDPLGRGILRGILPSVNDETMA